MEQGSSRPAGLHVAVVDHTAQLGGAELALVRLAEALGESVRLTGILFEDGPLAERLRRAGRDVRILPLPASVNTVRRDAVTARTALASVGRLARLGWDLARLVRALDVDVVHSTSLKADVVTALGRPLLGRPLVWHVHDRFAPDYLPGRTLHAMRQLARVPDAVIANSAATAATITRRRDVLVAPPGLAPAQVRSAPRPRPDGPPTVGVVGRIGETKDQLTFVRAAALVRRTHPEARFLIAGAPAFGGEEYARTLEDEIARLGLQDAVHLTGFVDDPTTVLDELALAVHTAAVPEPFGQVVTEAMARGVPVIATAGGGVDEIFTSSTGPVGWLVPAQSPDVLAATMAAALTDPDEAERRARRGWDHVRVAYGIEATASTVLQTWRSVAHQNPAVG